MWNCARGCKELPFTTTQVEVPPAEVPPVEVPAETLEFPLSSSQQAESELSATPVELAPAFPKSLSVPIILVRISEIGLIETLSCNF